MNQVILDASQTYVSRLINKTIKSEAESYSTSDSDYGKKNCKDTVWDNAEKIPGKDSKKYRADPYGNIMYYKSYGKHTPMSWQVDHIDPKKNGGTDKVINFPCL